MNNNINNQSYTLNKKENYLSEFTSSPFEISKIYETIIVEYLKIIVIKIVKFISFILFE
jgi:hypothetical protein